MLKIIKNKLTKLKNWLVYFFYVQLAFPYGEIVGICEVIFVNWL